MKILIIAAHPDDECLGMAGTIAKISKDNSIEILILGTGIASRNIQNKNEAIIKLRDESKKANNILGIQKIYFEDLPDNEFDRISLLNITKIVETYIEKIRPEIIFTHHIGDLNVDHQLTHRAVMTALRPIGNYSVQKIYSFEVLSSTEWGISESFQPNTYIDISDTIKLKEDALREYKSEIREYPHPRSIEGIKILAKKRGMEVGLRYAEAFQLIRDVRK